MSTVTTLEKPVASVVAGSSRYTPVRGRAFVMGAVLSPLLIFWAEYTEIVSRGVDLIAMSLVMAVVVGLGAVTALNAIVGLVAPRAALTRAELLVIYVINSTSMGISGLGMSQFLVNQLAGIHYFNTPTSGWNAWTYLVHSWAIPKVGVIADYYNGKSTLFTREHIGGWIVPATIWSLFMLTLQASMYCLAVLLRRQWVERERLLFPIAEIPLQLSTVGSAREPIWKNRLFWGGCGLAVALETLASMHYTINAAIPYVPLKPTEGLFNLGQFFSSPPWTGIAPLTAAFYPLVIGISYLLPVEILFSCWFFYFVLKAEQILCVSMGWRDPHDLSVMGSFPYAGYQGAGAFIMIAVLALTSAWPYLRVALRGKQDAVNEPIAVRTAFVGLVACSVLMIAFAMALGVTWQVAVLLFGLFLLYAVAVSRIRAEAGAPWSAGPVPMTHGTIVGLAGSHAFSLPNLIGLSQLRWFDADYRDLGMPAYLEAMKIVDSVRISPRKLTAGVALGSVVATFSSWIIILALYYHFGAANMALDPWRTGQGHYGFDEYQHWISAPTGPDAKGWGASVAGAVVVVVLSILRRTFVWWPLNPIGYAMANTGALDWLWAPILVGWLCKSTALRYGGVDAFRKTLPFFLGLIVGDYAAGGISSLIFLWLGITGYRTFPV